jgi:hypothetical protein
MGGVLQARVCVVFTALDHTDVVVAMLVDCAERAPGVTARAFYALSACGLAYWIFWMPNER